MNYARKNSSYHDTLLYHFQVGIPKELKTRFGVLQLRYTQHALSAANSDRYGAMQLPHTLDTESAKVIEVEADIFGNVVKVLYRVPHCANFNLILAVIPAEGFVKTVWLNQKNDCHKTLDRAKYTQPRRK